MKVVEEAIVVAVLQRRREAVVVAVLQRRREGTVVVVLQRRREAVLLYGATPTARSYTQYRRN